MPTDSHPARTRLRRRRLGLVVGAIALAVAACSAKAPSQEDLSQSLQDSGLSKPVANCTAKALTTSLSDSELQSIVERGGGGAPVDDTTVTNDGADKLAKAMTKCKDLLLSEQSTTTTAAVGTEETLPIDASSTTAATAGGDGAAFNTTTTVP